MENGSSVIDRSQVDGIVLAALGMHIVIHLLGFDLVSLNTYVVSSI